MYEWYLDDLPRRTEYLFDYINQFIDLPMDFTFETFKKVVDWLGMMLKINYKTPEEIEEEKRNTPEYAWEYMSNWELTDDSIILTMAVAGYLGMVMLNEIPNSRWELDTYKKSVTYNKAIIIKQSGGQLIPTRILSVLADEIIEHKELNLEDAIKSWCR